MGLRSRARRSGPCLFVMKLSHAIEDKTLRPIAEKVEQGIPVDREDARVMLATSNVLELAPSPIMCVIGFTAMLFSMASI